MPIVLPSSYSTYADSTKAGGDYILARVPSDADMTWIEDSRKLLHVEEFKSKEFLENISQLKAKPHIWRATTTCMRATSVFIIRKSTVISEVTLNFLEQGAEKGVDFTDRDINRECAISLIGRSPIAYLPNKVAEVTRMYTSSLVESFDEFLPENLLDKIGGKLNAAVVLTARAHASFTEPEVSHNQDGNPLYRPSGGRDLVYKELLSIQRFYDEEDKVSISVLNRAADLITENLASRISAVSEDTTLPFAQEIKSHEYPHVQASDIAAGWVRHLIELGGEFTLKDNFREVIINGVHQR